MGGKGCPNGMQNIKIQYKGMIGQLKSSNESQRLGAINYWREGFKLHKIAFLGNERSFETKHLKELFQLTYEYKCTESIKPLLEIYLEVITVRIMYLHINSVYYEEDSGKKDEYNDNVELENFSRCMEDISSAMSQVCPFFDAVRTLEHKKINFDTSKFNLIIDNLIIHTI